MAEIGGGISTGHHRMEVAWKILHGGRRKEYDHGGEWVYGFFLGNA